MQYINQTAREVLMCSLTLESVTMHNKNNDSFTYQFTYGQRLSAVFAFNSIPFVAVTFFPLRIRIVWFCVCKRWLSSLDLETPVTNAKCLNIYFQWTKSDSQIWNRTECENGRNALRMQKTNLQNSYNPPNKTC